MTRLKTNSLTCFVFIVCIAAVLGLFLNPPKAFAAFDRPHIFGINPTFDGLKVLDETVEAGGTATRLPFNWDFHEPQKGAYDFAALKQATDYAEQKGLAVYAIISGTPAWAKNGNLPANKALPNRSNTEDYKNFLKKLKQEIPSLKRFEFWNEENGCGSNTGSCGHTADSVREYAYWLDVTYKTLHSIDSQVVVSVGGTDGVDLPFVDLLLNSPGGRSFDVYSVHPYNWKGPINLQSVKSVYSKVQKPIWITEYGWNVGSGDTAISEQQQAQFLQETLAELVKPEYSFIQAAFFHSIRDFETGLRMGLISKEKVRRPAFTTFKNTSTSYLHPAPAGLASDLDTDGDVDIFDYNILLSNFGKTGSPGFILADIIKNGAVDIFDYNILLGDFGKKV